jgi:hypothetical protein
LPADIICLSFGSLLSFSLSIGFSCHFIIFHINIIITPLRHYLIHLFIIHINIHWYYCFSILLLSFSLLIIIIIIISLIIFVIHYFFFI